MRRPLLSLVDEADETVGRLSQASNIHPPMPARMIPAFGMSG